MTPRIENFPWKFTVPSTRHSSFRSLLSGKEFACPMYVCATHTAVIPAKAHCCPGKFFAVLAGKLKRRHSSESWNPVPLQIFKSLDSSFRWNDELMALNSHGKFSMRGVMPAHF